MTFLAVITSAMTNKPLRYDNAGRSKVAQVIARSCVF